MDWIELIDIQGNAVIPKRLKRVAKYAFKDCEELRSIVIPSGVTTIAESAFEGCRNLKSVSFPLHID